jgi:hypothetical protein
VDLCQPHLEVLGFVHFVQAPRGLFVFVEGQGRNREG